jgi:hypothetical protein
VNKRNSRKSLIVEGATVKEFLIGRGPVGGGGGIRENSGEEYMIKVHYIYA